MLFRNQRKIQKQASDMLKTLAKKMQVSSAQLASAVKEFAAAEDEGKTFPESYIKEMEESIITAERECDELKGQLIDKIAGIMPKAGEDYFVLLTKVDDIVNKVETAMRRLASRIEQRSKIPPDKLILQRIPHELPELADHVHSTTDYLQDALKVLDDDFKGALEAVEKVEKAREIARSLDFKIFGRLQSDDYSAKDAFFIEKISVSLVAVAVSAEGVANYIRMMLLKSQI